MSKNPKQAISTKKLQANQENAKKSTGPRTTEGKANSSKNALKHGLRSGELILQGIETEEEWAVHRDSIVASFSPVGAIELALAERVALGLWRLKRCVRAEGELWTTNRKEKRRMALEGGLRDEKLNDYGEFSEETWLQIQDEAERLQEIAQIWDRLETGKPNSPIDPESLHRTIHSCITTDTWNRLVPSLNETFTWPLRRIHQAKELLEWIAEQVSETPAKWLKTKADQAREQAAKIERQISRITASVEDAEKSALICFDITERLNRYETSIHRTLIKDLQELQRLQLIRLEKEKANAIEAVVEGG